MNNEKVATLAARAADQSLQDAYGELNLLRLKPENAEEGEKFNEILANLEDCHNWLMALGGT